MSEAKLLQHASAIFTSALQDCNIEAAFERKTQVVPKGTGYSMTIAGGELDLTGVRHLRIVSAGKAAGEMLTSFLARAPLAPGCQTQGVLIARDRPESLPPNIQFFAGGHPIPNQDSFDGAKAALEIVSEASTLAAAACVFLISGGASAMMELPLAPDISLEQTADLYRLLVLSGASIAEINCIRKHFSAVKGGRLAQAAGPTPVFTLLVSDVPPGHLDALASGPTAPDPTTIAECRAVFRRYSLEQALPPAIQAYFASALMQETPKPGELASSLNILLDSDDLVAAAERYASGLGYHVVVDHTCDDWPYQQAALYLLERIRALRTHYPRVCLLSAGEVAVPVPLNLHPEASHCGGRNQHLALHLATLLTPSDGPLAFLSAGSDGVDGNSKAAGGVVGVDTLREHKSKHSADLALSQFDSAAFFEAHGGAVVTGPTGNNLRDLRIVLADNT